MNSIIAMGVMYSSFLMVGMVLAFMPYLTRKTESFGVTIPEDIYHSDGLKNMRKKYSVQALIILILLSIGSAVLSYKAITPERASLIFGIGLTLLIACLFGLYLKYHFTMKRLKEDNQWEAEKPQAVVIDTSFRNHKLAYSNLWFLLPALIMLGTLAITVIYFDQIPPRIALQYDLSGEVTRWADKSYGALMWIPVQQLFMIVLFVLINSIISRAKQQINAANPEKSLIQNQIFRLRWSAYIVVTAISMVILFGSIQMSFIFNVHPKVTLLISGLLTGMLIIYAIILSVSTGQGGSRVKVSEGKATEEIDRDDDKYWKLGQFYFNPNDPTIFIEKRFGIGWTINFASVKGWLILAGIIAIVIASQFIYKI
ncbi:MAG: hypothetical protein APF84_00205 [Gracilibacter sp. BRH_c7a]|nr:MAG: hypothetical protein APF84_00205 [Gracilibacter sp. BRH_c7a]